MPNDGLHSVSDCLIVAWILSFGWNHWYQRYLCLPVLLWNRIRLLNQNTAAKLFLTHKERLKRLNNPEFLPHWSKLQTIARSRKTFNLSKKIRKKLPQSDEVFTVWQWTQLHPLRKKAYRILSHYRGCIFSAAKHRKMQRNVMSVNDKMKHTTVKMTAPPFVDVL